MGDQSGRTAVVTGGNAGIGFETARMLAGRGARVVLACRDRAGAVAAANRIVSAIPNADVSTVHLDLASLASVREAASELGATNSEIDVLINNGGVMELPYERTPDGFELTLATNHLGHFALTGLLLDRLLARPRSRIVTVSSEGHARGVIDFEDLQSENAYKPAEATLEVRDDGVGFQTQTTVGYGLGGMRGRVEQAGGRLTIQSGQTGTLVRAEVPA